jgi:hypothetical protein
MHLLGPPGGLEGRDNLLEGEWGGLHSRALSHWFLRRDRDAHQGPEQLSKAAVPGEHPQRISLGLNCHLRTLCRHL